MANWTSRAETLRKLKRAAQVQRGNGALLVTIVNLRHELETKNNAMRRLELAIQPAQPDNRHAQSQTGTIAAANVGVWMRRPSAISKC